MSRESQHTEWKTAWQDDHLRWLCGFANAEGGRLHLGRNDKGVVVGLADAAKLLVSVRPASSYATSEASNTMSQWQPLRQS